MLNQLDSKWGLTLCRVICCCSSMLSVDWLCDSASVDWLCDGVSRLIFLCDRVCPLIGSVTVCQLIGSVMGCLGWFFSVTVCPLIGYVRVCQLIGYVTVCRLCYSLVTTTPCQWVSWPSSQCCTRWSTCSPSYLSCLPVWVVPNR